MHSDFISVSSKPRPILRDLALLTILCAFINFTGITGFGVANWQEAIRLLASLEMQQQGDWVVPTIHGQTYLAKPPLVYWCTIALAELTGSAVTLAHLRFVVGTFGLTGVLMTYLAARSLLAGPLGWTRTRASHAAWWAGLFLATGLLHVRMSRTGSIDVAATPFVVGAVWACFESWRTTRGWQLRIGLAFLAAAMAAGASLVKGPPAILAILCPVFGGVLGYIASKHTRPGHAALRIIPIIGALTAIALGASRVRDVRDSVGLLLGGLGVLWFLSVAVGLTRERAVTLAQAIWRSQLVALVVGSFLPIWLWSLAVASRVGSEEVSGSAAEEMRNNVQVFVPASPIQLIEATSYGCGLGSIYTFIAAWLIATRRITLTPGVCVALAWVGVTLVAFGTLADGSGRYLTPMWPGVAILGAIAWLWFRDHPRREWMTTSTYATIMALAVGQAWWYADGRQRLTPERNSRAFITELVSRDDTDPARIATYGFWNGSFTYYAGHRVFPIDRAGYNMDTAGGRWSAEDFARRVREDNAPWTLLISFKNLDEQQAPELPAEIASLGLDVTPIELESVYAERKGRHPVRAFRVTP